MSYFSEAELRTLPQMGDTTKYPTAAVTEATGWIEAVIERKCGVAFVARTVTETYDGNEANSRGGIILRCPYVQAVTAVTSNLVAFTAVQLTQLKVRSGVLHWYTASAVKAAFLWDFGVQNIDVTYTHGYTTVPPADIKVVAMTAARDFLLRRYGAQGATDRAVSMSTDLGSVQYATANDLYRPTGIPDVDAVIMGYANRLDVYGFA